MTNPAFRALAAAIDIPFAASRCCATAPRVAARSTDREIRDFLAGRTDGEAPLHSLYDYVLDEPVPERLRAALAR
jgi:hypothetical protein